MFNIACCLRYIFIFTSLWELGPFLSSGDCHFIIFVCFYFHSWCFLDNLGDLMVSVLEYYLQCLGVGFQTPPHEWYKISARLCLDCLFPSQVGKVAVPSWRLKLCVKCMKISCLQISVHTSIFQSTENEHDWGHNILILFCSSILRECIWMCMSFHTD
jgi:hypothetical protein